MLKYIKFRRDEVDSSTQMTSLVALKLETRTYSYWKF